MEKKEILSDTIATQLKSLMEQADLTIEGLSEAAGLSTHTISKILKKQTRISSKTLDKLTGLFGISAAAMLSSAKIKLSEHHKRRALDDFHQSNEANPKYFQSRAKENVVAHFLRTVLLNDPYLDQGRRVSEIATYIREKREYQKDFDPKVIAKALERLWRDGKLNKEDRTGKASVYFYSRKNKG